MYRWQGLTPRDTVHSVYGHGMINGGHYIREAVTHFTNSLFLSAGTGIETRSAAQVNLIADFGVTSLSALGKGAGMTDLDAALEAEFPNFLAILSK